MDKPQGIGEKLYQDAASFGRFKALIILIVGLVISVIICFIGIYKMIINKHYTSETYARITQMIGCVKKSSFYECKVSIEYIIDNKKYQRSDIQLSRDKPLSIGDMITIYYDPMQPNDILVDSYSSGGLLIGIAIFIALSCYVTYWLSNRYSIFAAAEATSTLAGLFRR